MADSIYAGSVLGAMQDKDPELFASLTGLDAHSAMMRWVDKYPDDFPLRGATSVSDTTAIKPKQAAA